MNDNPYFGCHIVTAIHCFTTDASERSALERQAKALRDLPEHSTVNN